MHNGHRERVRKRFLNEGLDNFEPHEVLELLLYYAVPRRDTNELSHKLLKKYGSLSAVLEASVSDLEKNGGLSQSTAVLMSLIPHLSRRYMQDRWGNRPIIGDSTAAGEYCVSLAAGRLYEVFYVICMDKQRRVIRAEIVFEGTVDETPAYPRHIVETVLRYNAQNVILMHNHPSGSLQPSGADIEVTKRVVTVLEAMDINVVDHIIVAGERFTSFADRGLMPN